MNNYYITAPITVYQTCPKLQMLTTRFKELKMSEDESFDYFYTKLNEVVIGKFNLGEKMEDLKIVWKILRSLSESFCAGYSN